MGNNVNIEAKIPLVGDGLVIRPYGGFEPGQYKRLVNMELDKGGSLVPRFGFYNAGQNDVNALNEPRRFIGSIYDKVIVHQGNNMRAISEYENYAIPMTGYLAAPVVNQTFVHAFTYRNYVYWVSVAEYGSAPLFRIMLHKSTVEVKPTDPIPTTYAGYTHTVIANSVITVAGDWMQNVISKVFVHKDRLWVFTKAGMVYFSKATDFTIWTTPDGGFFDLRPSTIASAVYVKDSIYIATPQGIYTLTYSTDPNTDSTLNRISDSFNANAMVAYKDLALFVDNDVLYSVQNSYVQKVRDLNLGSLLSPELGPVDPQFIFVYNQYIIISYNQGGVGYNPGSTFVNNLVLVTPKNPLEGETLTTAYATYTYQIALNMDTGCMFELDFHDMLHFDAVFPKSAGYIIDYLVNSQSDQKLFVLTRHNTATSAAGYVYYARDRTMVTFPSGEIIVDSIDRVQLPDAGALGAPGSWQTRNFNVEIDSYSPDGSEGEMKKFRSLIIEGRLPELNNPNGPTISVAYGDTAAYSTVSALLDTTSPNRPLAAYRFPLNQRARAISLKIFSKIISNPLNVADDDGALSIGRLSLYWTYLQRLPVSRNKRVDV